MLVEGVDDHVDAEFVFSRRLCSTGGRCRSKSVCNSFTSLLANYVYTKHTPLSFASWCMLHIHNSASLRGVSADTPLSFASLAYLLHIHNSAAPRLCICAYTILSSDVRHYYTPSSV